MANLTPDDDDKAERRREQAKLRMRRYRERQRAGRRVVELDADVADEFEDDDLLERIHEILRLHLFGGKA